MKGGLEKWTEKLGIAVSAVTASASATAQQLGKKLQQEALGAECLLAYHVGAQTACAGPGGLWRVYTARAKKEGSPHPLVACWVLDKREVTQAEEQVYGGGSSGGGALTRPSARRLELFLEQCRHDVQALTRLKHPCILRLISPLEETRTQLVFITEPLFASLADLLGGAGTAAGASGTLPPTLASERRQLRLSELELKHGLLQVADGLHFLHSEAGLVHRGIAPTSIVITQTGAWKLAGFAFSSPQDFQTPNQRAYDYSEREPSILQQVAQPALAYVAPELVASGTTSVTGAADVFSLGAVAFELLTRRPLLPVGHNLAEYESRVHSLTLMDMSGVPSGLEQPLRAMLAPIASARPPAAAFAGCQYFQSDVLLRALKFLDTMLQRDSLQKAAFLRDLPAMCAQLDTRVLRYKVLPPLLAELRDPQLQPSLLPIVLNIVQQQEAGEFADTTLPALKPLLASATGETLLLLVQNAELLSKCMPPAAAAQVLPALLVRAAQHGDVRAQEEMLKKAAAMAESLDYEGLKGAVLPAVHALCLGTTSASVRVRAFAAMSCLVGRTDQKEAELMLQTGVKVTAVDRSAPTAMSVLALGGGLAKQWGPRLAAERVLPTLAPLLVAPTLNSQQFAAAMRTVREILAQIEKGRAGGAADGGMPNSSGGGGVGTVGSASVNGGGLGGGDGRQGGQMGAGPAAANDWLAATAVGPVPSSDGGNGSGSSGGGGGGAGWGQKQAAGGGGGGSGDLLAGLQLQQGQQPGMGARPAAAAAGSGSRFGPVGGQVGAATGGVFGGAPSLSAGGSPAAAQQPGWAFAAPPAAPALGSGVAGTGMRPGQQQQQLGSSPGRGFGGSGFGAPPPRPGAPLSASSFGQPLSSLQSSSGGGQGASLADPFAGLQLGGPGPTLGSSGGGGGNVRAGAPWPVSPASFPGSSGTGGGARFDPFGVASSQPSGGSSSGGAALQWPQPSPPQQGQQQQGRLGGAGPANFAAGAGGSLI